MDQQFVFLVLKIAHQLLYSVWVRLQLPCAIGKLLQGELQIPLKLY